MKYKDIDIKPITIGDRLRIADLQEFTEDLKLKNLFTVSMAYAKAGTGLTDEELYAKFEKNFEAEILNLGMKVRELSSVNPTKE